MLTNLDIIIATYITPVICSMLEAALACRETAVKSPYPVVVNVVKL